MVFLILEEGSAPTVCPYYLTYKGCLVAHKFLWYVWLQIWGFKSHACLQLASYSWDFPHLICSFMPLLSPYVLRNYEKISILKKVEVSGKKARWSHKPNGLHHHIHRPSSWKASSLVSQLVNPKWTCYRSFCIWQ